ncbi:uncharacterized protein LOC120456403 [Drosophila santomea]|uniref:uncharacterized protein LOC120456403 n=1 Tax=Drosophila santomea TaxID=129105 RepID=UPI0019538A67|nr:uncharacterized protein LOC120456403 [Drosophila santomea]
MEPCDPGPERAMRQYLTRLLETGTSRSTGCLDRFVQKGMSNFPPQSSALEGKTSRCSLFEQLLSGESRKSERLLVPDLATEWFRKQKVFLDKLSPEELAALSDGLAVRDSKKTQPVSKSGAVAPIASQMKDAEESEGKVATCIPTTEPRDGNGNPFLLGNAQAQEVHSKGAKRRRFHWERAGHRCPVRRGSCSCLKRRAGASCDCLFQADGQPMASDCLEAALRTEPLLPCLRRKFDLRQAPQRRLDPARFRRISPEFYRILASYEAAMSESCPLYGISMHHWGDTEPCCPCGERHTNAKQRFLGDDSVATSVLAPSWPPLESRPMEDNKQPAKKQAERKGSKSLKEKSEKLKKCCCTNDTCPNECCAVTKGTGKKQMDDSSTSEDEREEQWRRKQVDKQVEKADDQRVRQVDKQPHKADGQRVRQVDSGQTAQSLSPSENRHPERWQGRRSENQQERQQANPERRRRFPYCFHRQSQSYRAAYAPSHFSPLSSYPSDLPAPTNPSASAPTSLPASSTASTPASSSSSPEMPRECQCRHQPRGILSGFTGICKRCIEPGRHLLYNLNANYQQNRERYGQMRQNKKRPFHIASQPAPCSWQKSKGYSCNERIEQGDSSITLRPQSLAETRFQNCHPDSEVMRGQANSEQSLPFRTPASERTLAGWDPVQQEQPHLEVAQCQPDCKCALPQQSFQLPPVSNCTFALAEAQQEVLQSVKVARKSSSELDYLKCGHRVRACYLANDFHQLMKRVARKRPRAKSSSPPSTAKAAIRQQSTEASGASSSERSKIQAKSHAKPIITPRSKPRILGALLPEEFTAKRLSITNSATVKLRSLRKVKKKKQDREPKKENYSMCRVEGDVQDQKLPSSSQVGYSSKSSSKASSRGTSPKSQRAAKSSNRSASKERSQKRPSSCSSSSRSSQRERSSSGQRWAAQHGVPDTPSTSDASYWTQKRSREPAKQSEQRQRFQSNSTYPSHSDVYSSQYSRVQSPYRSSALKSSTRKAAIQYQASLPSTAPRHLETGRRYYTDTQPGGGEVAGGARCSCRSLRSTTSIRALSSNTDSVRCPCAPAPSVASVDPAQEVQVHVAGEQQDEHSCCCRYHTPPLDAAYLQPSSTPTPPPCACRRHKAMLFSDAMRWQPQQHHHARTLLRTQRPPPPPSPSPPPAPALLKHQHLLMFPQYPQYHVENAAVERTPEWLPEYQAPGHYPSNASQRWEDSPYCTQNNYLMPDSPRNNSYAGQSTYQESLGGNRAGAIRAAAQGLRGVVQALGGTRSRSRHNPQLDCHQQSGYSQEQNPINLEPGPYQNQVRVLHSNAVSHLQAQAANNHMDDEASLYTRPSTSTHYENYPLRNEIPSSCNARRSMERDQSTFRMEGGRRQAAGCSSLSDKPQKLSHPTPLAMFFESLRAKHAASAIPTTKQSLVNDCSDSMPSSSSDDEADADDSLDWRHRHRQLRSPSQDTMVIPPTYTGLLEEQVLGEYLPSPRCKRRT